ncbi:hypothetical protein N658DRAFT_221160 [Parathielavia hyrcaniae]|uniref:Uncharacterized protein n=1 Tax=Parathielavia hyrcaniae TaxID=113614 RepID=A0AAN6PUT2_9PEZI|nr:hypothetical protein N658DRAFT_221160 [Parathielavia hyrcaniae]
MCSGASGNSFIRGIRDLGPGRESPRPTLGLARYNFDYLTETKVYISRCRPVTPGTPAFTTYLLHMSNALRILVPVGWHVELPDKRIVGHLASAPFPNLSL